MIGKYINQFMADNELLVNEEFFIKNMDGNRVLIGLADRYKTVQHIKAGDRIAQMLIERNVDVEFVVVDELSETDRGAGGFGSTGVR